MDPDARIEEVTRYVHGYAGLIRATSVDVPVQDIKRWREAADEAGQPSGLNDFYAAHGICTTCHGQAVVMVGLFSPSAPGTKEMSPADPEKLYPLYKVCPDCEGAGGRTA